MDTNRIFVKSLSSLCSKRGIRQPRTSLFAAFFFPAEPIQSVVIEQLVIDVVGALYSIDPFFNIFEEAEEFIRETRKILSQQCKVQFADIGRNRLVGHDAPQDCFIVFNVVNRRELGSICSVVASLLHKCAIHCANHQAKRRSKSSPLQKVILFKLLCSLNNEIVLPQCTAFCFVFARMRGGTRKKT